MFYEVITGTDIMFYLMIAVGVIGGVAKVVNLFTLRRMARAAGNMSKSTHRLIRLVRAKYEHACMLHDRVENAEAFVEKYIYEYRGMGFRIHTWRQLEVQSIWFAGILAALGAVFNYTAFGMGERVYQFAALGAAEMVLLFVISQVSDEQYRMEAIKNYMVDYLENVCAYKYRKLRQSEREQKARIDVIQPEAAVRGAGNTQGNVQGNQPGSVQEKEAVECSAANEPAAGPLKSVKRKEMRSRAGRGQERPVSRRKVQEARRQETRQKRGVPEEGFLQAEQEQEERFQEERYSEAAHYIEETETELPINIEGEPRNVENGEKRRCSGRKTCEPGNRRGGSAGVERGGDPADPGGISGMTESGVSAQGKIRPFSTLYTCATHIEVKNRERKCAGDGQARG